MPQKVSVLQEYEPKDWSGLTTRNHLAAIYAVEPQMFTNRVTMLYQINYGMDLEAFLRQFPVKKFKTDDDFRWMLQGRANKNIPLASAYINGTAVSATSQAGLNYSTFELEFPEPYFAANDIIVGEYNEIYPIRVKNSAVSQGTNDLYTCELITGDQNLFIPYDQLINGKRFSREYNLVEKTLSVRGGHVNYTSPFAMKNVFSIPRNRMPGPVDSIRPSDWNLTGTSMMPPPT